MLFALNLSLSPTEDLFGITANAETADHQPHSLQVEYVGALPSLPWLYAVVLRLSDELTTPGDVLVGLTVHGVKSNRVRIGVGAVGGGPPDDSGAMPTPVPPYEISGRVTAAGQPLPGVNLILSGDQTGAFTTDPDGFYSILVNSFGSYTISASKQSYEISPVSKAFINLSGHQLGTNFSATKLVNIHGLVVGSGNQPLANTPVSLGGFQSSTTTTDSSGVFTFNTLPAGHDYTVNVPPTPFYSFTQQTFTNLTDNTESNFVGTLRNYSISGSVTSGSDTVANQKVTLTGGTTASTTTDINGRFVFPEVPAAGNYQVTPEPTALKTFPTQNISNLSANQTLSFSGIPRKYVIAGTVTDGSNNSIPGVRVELSGSESAIVRTDGAGRFSFNVTVLGNYTLTPTIEQQYFLFAPASRTVDALIGDQALNFSGTLQLPNPQKVLEFDGSPKTVDYFNFWPAFTDLGHFYWEFWAMPGPNQNPMYLLSDGYGGLHALLFGLANFNTEPNRYQILGNVNDGVLGGDHIFYFAGDQGPAIGEWGHIAVGWDGQNIITYFDGVPVGRTPYARPRQSVGPGQGSGRLLIGGSDHLNFAGRIAQVRGFEGTNPRELTSVESSFAPQSVFTPGGNLMSWYFNPGSVVADLSNGYNTCIHSGLPRGTTAGILADCGSCTPPQFVTDPTAPNFVANIPGQGAPTPIPPQTPDNVLVFDSFSRTNSTYTFGSSGGLGSTETGSAGPQVWQMDQDANQKRPFGILNGAGVVLADAAAVGWVNTGSGTGNLDIQVDRKRGTNGSGTCTGLSFRVRDHANYFFAYTNEVSAGAQTLTVGYYLDGFKTTLASGITIPQSWSTLRVVTLANGNIQIFIDWTPVYSTSELVLSRETKAGIYNGGPGMGLVNRWDNFRVFAAN
jgi:hypothetical protein